MVIIILWFWDCQDELIYSQIFAFIFIIFPSQITLSY